MQITFHHTEEHHFPQIKEIYDWYIANTTATFHTEPVTIGQLKEFIFVHHPRYKSYIIKVDEQMAGYCFLTYYKNRQAYDRTAEVTIYLKPNFCHKGLGKIALAYLEEKAAGTDIRNLVGIISGDNRGSIALFEHAGFTKCAHFRNVGEKFNKILDVVAYQKETGM